jgi:hypothetical protein
MRSKISAGRFRGDFDRIIALRRLKSPVSKREKFCEASLLAEEICKSEGEKEKAWNDCPKILPLSVWTVQSK